MNLTEKQIEVIKAHGHILVIGGPGSGKTTVSILKIRASSKKLNDDEKQRQEIANERDRLARTEGRICFDLFARYVNSILLSQRICRLVAMRYPVIILDEFQDTNQLQWDAIKVLGKFCRLIVLADPEQSIHAWAGADPRRLDHFREAFSPKEVNLSTDNHRSSRTEILSFGNDVLTGIFTLKEYKGINIDFFEPFHNSAMTKLITTIYSARNRLTKEGINNWSLAILVPTKKMTHLVSNALRQPPAGMAAIPHFAAIEMEAAILGAEVIAHLLQPSIDGSHFQKFVTLVCKGMTTINHQRPRKTTKNQINKSKLN